MLSEILPVYATPQEFELGVLEWVKRSNPTAKKFKAMRLATLEVTAGTVQEWTVTPVRVFPNLQPTGKTVIVLNPFEMRYLSKGR